MYFSPGCAAATPVWFLLIYFKQGFLSPKWWQGEVSLQSSCLACCGNMSYLSWAAEEIQKQFAIEMFIFPFHFDLVFILTQFCSDFWTTLKKKKKKSILEYFRISILENISRSWLLFFLSTWNQEEIKSTPWLLFWRQKSCFLISSWHWLSDFAGVLNWDDGFAMLELIPKQCLISSSAWHLVLRPRQT